MTQIDKILVPHELKTIQVDVDKKLFLINGEEFGKGCTGFTISCSTVKNFQVRVELDTTVCFASYDENQQKVEEKTYQSNDSWFPLN